jgi:hypothetical protein
MTASGGLQSDARRAVYEEDVVTYADDDTAEEWGDPQNYSATAVGLVSRVAGSDDEWSSDEEPEEVRIELGWRVASVYRDNPPTRRAVRDAREDVGDARDSGSSRARRAPPTRRRSRATPPSKSKTRETTS